VGPCCPRARDEELGRAEEREVGRILGFGPKRNFPFSSFFFYLLCFLFSSLFLELKFEFKFCYEIHH
jgi:hypothetical protein